LETIGNWSPEIKEKMDAAFTVIDAVEKAGNYIKALSDLFSDGQLTLPVGINNGDYVLAVDRIAMDENGQFGSQNLIIRKILLFTKKNKKYLHI